MTTISLEEKIRRKAFRFLALTNFSLGVLTVAVVMVTEMLLIVQMSMLFYYGFIALSMIFYGLSIYFYGAILVIDRDCYKYGLYEGWLRHSKKARELARSE